MSLKDIALPTAALIIGAIAVCIAIIRTIHLKELLIQLTPLQSIFLGVFGALLVIAGFVGYFVSPQSSTNLLSLTPAAQPTATFIADTRCKGKEVGAIIAGNPVPLTDWQADCAYHQVLNGEIVVLTTWGIMLQYADKTIANATIIPPGVAVNAPLNSVLFAGYYNRDGVEQAYRLKNPDAPTPIP
ncbi:MAG: hypothetical protein HYZ49_10560 [Chloroflexi bacterium]|nr:hypothetical protein [Chloroflexota bacterium]